MPQRIAMYICLVLILIQSCSKNEKSAEQKHTPEHDDRPAMRLSMADGNDVNVKDLNTKIVLVLFQPDCDHCQREAKEIQQHADAFKDYQVYFISSNPMEIIVKFGEDYELNKQANFHFAQTTVESVLNTYGPIATPSVYIYSKNGKLVKQFNGETDIQEIIKVL
ncbi:peroxiredoxin family protein [Chryseosolibacter indicus]|uniref:Redoxin domain-containing protein n=1 Tax=Chryseosolibacter indicus TaxID=2782351 RepID=A0ABS5VZN3_9BACT|nr:redoxin domain-containing protein [Chryseosolibacter indicus]MBT1706379.1 redoxin domain-containing protein [Chryseosolibacter indicus]